MANPEHLAKLKEGVTTWNGWRKKYPDVAPDLSSVLLGEVDLFEADLSGANLCGAGFDGAQLGFADLTGADLTGARFNHANLGQAKLGRAKLRSATFNSSRLLNADLHEEDLSGARLVFANLENTNLSAADLTDVDLEGALFLASSLDHSDLTGASLRETTFANVDLSSVRGLETVSHSGPSSIGIDTIYKSKGRIPHEFLRGCGVPENLITYMASLVGTGIQFYSLFISYATRDQEFAERLHADLQAKGVRCWFAPHDIRAGRKLHEQIDEAIRVHDKLLLILSSHSMESEWVKAEIFKAREREISESRRVLFPIRVCSFDELRDWKLFDCDNGKDSAREIREYFIPDFSNWKDHDAYKLAFDRLLHDLQGKPDPPLA
jgi:hypothetical protein